MGLESFKSLAAVFHINIIYFDKNVELEHVRKEEAYIQNIKGFYKFVGIALLSLVVPFILVINDATFKDFLWILLSCGVLIAIYSLNIFDFFGDDWKNKMIEKRFKNN